MNGLAEIQYLRDERGTRKTMGPYPEGGLSDYSDPNQLWFMSCHVCRHTWVGLREQVKECWLSHEDDLLTQLELQLSEYNVYYTQSDLAQNVLSLINLARKHDLVALDKYSTIKEEARRGNDGLLDELENS